MPELLHRRANSIETPAAATPDHGTPGKQTRAGDGPAAAVASPSAVSRVKAQAGKDVAEGGFTYRVNDRGEFVVTGAPDSAAHAKDRVIKPEGAYAAAWKKLAEILLFPDRRSRTPAAAPAAAPAPSVDATDDATNDPLAHDANLVAAKNLADSTTVPHSDSASVDGDVKGWKRREAIIGGDVAKMKTMVCSEFTSLSLQKSGVDLNQRYIDPRRKLPVGYKDASRNLVFADLYRVTMNQRDTLEAILAAQHGGGKEIKPGSPEALALRSTADFTFIYVEGGDLSLDKGDVIGAAATAQQLGGTIVAERDRRPGDLQQWMDTAKGKGGNGHSSQIWAVRGTGVAYFGAAGSPTIVPMPTAEIAPGWYAVDGVFWEVGPGTDPAMIASLDVGWVQLIEANLSTTDATRIDKPRAADKDYDPDARSSRLTSVGRLPTSKWAAWQSSTPAIAGTIKPGGVVSASSE